jgi:hypothetical protein
MKLQKAFQIALYFLLVVLIVTACSPARQTFKSDEQIKDNFQNQKSKLAPLIKQCKSEEKSQGLKRHTRESFSTCKVKPTQLRTLNIEEVSLEFIGLRTSSKELKGSRILFITNQYVDDYVGTFVEEKGYMFSAIPVTQNLIKEGSLDQFVGKELFLKRGSNEVWKYKQIEPNWYIYYRQYFYPYLG